MTTSTSNKDSAYWDLWKTKKDPDAGDFLVKKYMPLVHYHVQRISTGLPKSVKREELKSLAFVGLFDAIEKFDPSRDLKFDTYASFRIRGSIIDGLRKEDWLPRSVREKAKRIESTLEKLEQKLMRNATVEEVAAHLDMPEEEVSTVMHEVFYSNILSMDEMPKENDEQSHGAYVLKDEKVISPEEELIKSELIQLLGEQIENLTENEQIVISLFYKEELTLTEIGQVLGLTTSRISQIHSKAIFKLRKQLNPML
ncbi:FliA/WhiG family RNA polymerase sigma factor [Sutcliffiella horikoshii]|uniref:FliA/WhiG family RNA polymerase sigma factor n=1 Tax=Sutcliffiella horikoshii TaxID=79883 RepID=A0A1Y0CM48_9BACI|nr:FliA/WhiG family RNA polymerase sigma factor [Sutcliffiella horikoshii]ART76369.1 FliA/WhiG family RNA polymerase sigma factor [Sutcliffiella horikoshii]TYS61631.1 FliA/WhiG family RNA polymerase sigma factor [Sutcliffiella horikoshii]